MSASEKISFLDRFVSKTETSLSLAFLSIGGLVGVTLLDYGTLALGLKETLSLPNELTLFATTAGTTFIGYIIGKKS